MSRRSTSHTRLPARRLLAALALSAVGCAQLQTLSTEDALGRLNIATTKLYAADGSLVANLHGEINRDIVPLERIPPHVQNAVIAIEDERFWTHPGLDLKSIGRAVVENVESATRATGGLQGGSTISQQLVKNLYFAEPERTVKRKLAEARVTVQFERQYSKRQILEMYLNTIYLGRGVYGFQTAARSYFHKDASELSVGEGAFLAGLIHEPASYDWVDTSGSQDRAKRKQGAVGRRNLVLTKMTELGLISQEARARAAASDLTIQAAGQDKWKYAYFVDMVLRQLGVLRNSRTDDLDPRFAWLGDGFQERARNLYRGGLRIYTTLDPKMQEAAEAAVAKNLPAKIDRLYGALAALEPKSGHVRAVVGGRNYYTECSAPGAPTPCLAKVNLALGDFGGGSGRQPGSAFKPIVLATALERGVSLRTYYSAAPFTQKIPGSAPWKVANYEGGGGGAMSVVEGTISSVNAVYARLEVEGVGEGDPLKGSERVAATARKLGLPFPTRAELRRQCGDDYGRKDSCIAADDVPAIALGAREVSPLEVASAYAAFPNDGIHVQPTAIVKITDARGKVMYEADPIRQRGVAQGVARGVSHVLTQVVERGTGTKARLDRPAAGKTGTSQEWRDAWFVGYTPQLAAAIWVGGCTPGETRCTPESMTPRNGYPLRVVGGTYPAQIWHDFMTAALDGVPVEKFEPPPAEILNAVPKEYEGPPAPVPDVLGFPRDLAAGALLAAGFKVKESTCLAQGVPDGVVVKQTPAGGTEAPIGSSVNVCLSVNQLPQFVGRTPTPWWLPGGPSQGGTDTPEQGTVPGVVGKNRARAQADIADAGYDSVAVAECEPSGQTSPGYVWRQSPGPGTTMHRGASVTIWYHPPGCG